eukprot:TRINITY_DN136672_c0_g1_i1.p1 TRINITY_DN136672_c0_g1~~TRINITY_DN136672_c0_g1_i1.p1  ORF type:complete len:184 (-),score=68.57 TRINITY_DN136672_c0_g1_i1:8-559(-)
MFRYLAVILLLAAAVYSSNPSVIVYKQIVTDYPTATRPMFVVVNIFNVGENPIYDINVNDDTWPKDGFQLVSGTPTAKFDQLAPGTNVSITLELIPQSNGEFDPVQAVVTYKTDADSETTETIRSNDIRNFYILTTRESDRLTTNHGKEWFVYALLNSVTLVPAYLIYSQKSKYFKSLEKKRN